MEHKRGRPKKDDCDRIQLCAQAVCLEEMLGLEVPCGALFYGKTRRRQDVIFDVRLRGRTRELAAELHAMLDSGRTPAPVLIERCAGCSLNLLCLPKLLTARRSARRYLLRAVRE